MEDLLAYRAQRLGITFHRDRTLDAVLRATIDGGPLLDLLFAITRARPEHVRPGGVADPAPQQRPGSVTLPKGMVHYQHGVVPSLGQHLAELHDRRTSR
jgi:hypothetical protein